MPPQDSTTPQNDFAPLQGATSLHNVFGDLSPTWDGLVPLLANSGPMLDDNGDETRRVGPVGVDFVTLDDDDDIDDDDDGDESNSPRGVHEEDAKAVPALFDTNTGALVSENEN